MNLLFVLKSPMSQVILCRQTAIAKIAYSMHVSIRTILKA